MMNRDLAARVVRALGLVAPAGGTLINSGPCVLRALNISNIAATPAFVKLYDAASGVTVGTTTPVITIAVPTDPNGTGTGMLIAFDCGPGIKFANGIIAVAVTASADAGSTAMGAGTVTANFVII